MQRNMYDPDGHIDKYNGETVADFCNEPFDGFLGIGNKKLTVEQNIANANKRIAQGLPKISGISTFWANKKLKDISDAQARVTDTINRAANVQQNASDIAAAQQAITTQPVSTATNSAVSTDTPGIMSAGGGNIDYSA